MLPDCSGCTIPTLPCTSVRLIRIVYLIGYPRQSFMRRWVYVTIYKTHSSRMLPSLSIGFHLVEPLQLLLKRNSNERNITNQKTSLKLTQLIPFKDLHDPFRVNVINRTVPTALAPVDSGLKSCCPCTDSADRVKF